MRRLKGNRGLLSERSKGNNSQEEFKQRIPQFPVNQENKNSMTVELSEGYCMKDFEWKESCVDPNLLEMQAAVFRQYQFISEVNLLICRRLYNNSKLGDRVLI